MKALSCLRAVERSVAVGLFLMMVALYFVNILTRLMGGTFASDFAWIEEAVRLMSLFVVFLVVGLALERGRHASVNSWRDRIARRTGLPLRRIIDAIGFVFCVYLVWLGARMTMFVYSTGQRSPTLDVPVFWIYLAPTIGFALMGLRFALSFAGLIDRYSVQAQEEA